MDQYLQLIPFTILIIIAWVLHKKGILSFRITTKIKYVASYTPLSFKASYQTFDGFEYFYFRFKKGSKLTMKYTATVEKGTLTIELRNRKGHVFTEVITSDHEGEYHFTAQNLLHSIRLDGEKAGGACSVQFIVGECRVL
ncbi:hypothetical protein [Caldalkalibacillus mannanilyticus]|uniref:hypothetical protein n=1 Tax=Caldalkalibacillus mannanilyticus TaxID=1418 RepID=UPI00046969D8|nr:hypothetical protein [Caldalkalibacillus mannanilyticus]